MTKGWGLLLLQAAIAGVCVYYLLQNLDAGRLGTALTAIPLWLSGASLLCVLILQALVGLRLHSLLPRLGYWQCFQAEALGTGVNNILPAKMGELAKVAYLSRRLQEGVYGALDAVFWSRLFDVNALLLLGLAAGTQLSMRPVVIPLAAVMLCAWLMLALFRLWPGLTGMALRLLPAFPLLAPVRQLVQQIPQRLSLPFLLRMGIGTATIWGLEVLLHGLVLRTLFSPCPTWSQVLTITTAGLLGLVAPGPPGAVGVYEAALVFALGAYGYDKETALAAAVFLHLAQALPCTAIGLWVFSGEGLSLGSLLRNKRAQTPSATPPPQ
jgi:hypothetical protein